MIFFSLKKKKLDNIYSKIGEQSKQSFFLKKTKNKDASLFVEFFQTNLILIIWYMKSRNFENKNIDYLINKYIKDLEGLVIELGGSETSLRKKIRIIIGNFYGRLYRYSIIFDEIEKKKKTDLKKILKKNFKYPLKLDLLEEYIKKNIYQLIQLDENEFWNLKFFNEK